METRIEHAVLHIFLFQELGKQFGLLNGNSTNQYGLAPLICFTNGLGDGAKFVLRIFVELVVFINTLHGQVGGNFNDIQLVNFVEFTRFGRRGSGHARQFGIHAEIVLEGDCCERLVLWLNIHAFFGFDCLMQAV